MGDTFVISGLIQKRAEIFGVVVDLEKRVRRARDELAHIDATILIFDPEANPAGIKAKRSSDRTGWFENGEKSRKVRDMLREASEPLASAHIVRVVMAERGLDANDKRTRTKLTQSFLNVLSRMQAKGEIEKIGMGLGARWRLAR